MATTDSITLPKFYSLLENHDWHYEYSDDHKVWKRGQDNQAKLVTIARESDTFAELYKSYQSYISGSNAKPSIDTDSAETRHKSLSGAPAKFNYRNLKALVSGGQIFSVEFIKRTTGEIRKMTCRLGVTKYLKGGNQAYNASSRGLLTVFDVQAKGYRSIPVEAIKRLSVGGQTFSFEGA